MQARLPARKLMVSVGCCSDPHVSVYDLSVCKEDSGDIAKTASCYCVDYAKFGTGTAACQLQCVGSVLCFAVQDVGRELLEAEQARSRRDSGTTSVTAAGHSLKF